MRPGKPRGLTYRACTACGVPFGRTRAALQDVMVRWLFDQRLDRLHLETGTGTRAQGFYEASGWSYIGLNAKGEALYERYAGQDS